jgi:staphyloferrin B biosynthesis citrate synthase
MALNLVAEARRRHLLGIHSSSGSPAFMEFFGLAGLDFVIIGMETEPVGRGELEGLLRACGGGVTPIVKLRRSNADELDDALVAGARWVALPHITGRKQLDELLRRSQYRPRGERSVCPTGRTFGYSTASIDEIVAAESGAALVPIIEDPEALEHLDEIFAADASIYEIGPFDLAVALGFPTSSPYTEPAVVDAIRRIAAAARKHDKLLLGPYWHPPEDEGAELHAERQAFLVDLGFRIFYLGSEFQLLRWAVRRGRRTMDQLDATSPIRR